MGFFLCIVLVLKFFLYLSQQILNYNTAALRYEILDRDEEGKKIEAEDGRWISLVNALTKRAPISGVTFWGEQFYCNKQANDGRDKQRRVLEGAFRGCVGAK